MGEWKLPGLEPYPNQPPSPSGGRRTAAPGPGPVAEACGGSGGLAALLLQWRSGGGSGGGEPRGPPGPVAEAAGDAASAAGGPAALLPWHGGGPGDRIARGGGGGGALWLADEGAGGGGGGAAQAGRQGGLVDLGGEGGEGEQPRRDSDRTPGARRRTRSASGGGGAALRVYQVLPPSLCQRAHVFGNRMALKDGATCLDLPYFDAPGTLHADLSASIALGDPKARGAQRQELPPMTTVFIAVEGAASFMRRHRKLAAQLHDQLCRVLQSALRCVPGGYVARVSGGDLKYLAAFYEAGDALQWCLLVQEAAMYAPWTAAVLRQSGFGEVVDPATGRILFRGPRLKMGVCEGRPRCVMPDHAGRADYHGATVNQAARYMDAAAHGGMIAAESGLLRSVFALWRGELPPEFTDVPEHSDVAAAAAAVQRSYAAAAAAAAPPAILSLDEGHEGAEADSDLEPDHNGAVEITVDGNEDEAAAAAAPPAAAAAAASAAGGRATPAASMLDRFLRSRGTGMLQVNASGGSGSTTASLASAVSPAFFGHRRSMQGPHRASAGGVSVSAALLADLTRPPASPLEAAAVSEMKMQLAQASAAAAAQMQAVASTAAAADGQSESSAGDQVSAGLTPPVIGSGSFSGVVPSVRVRTDLLQTSGPRFLCPEAFTKVPSDVIAVNIGRWKFKGSDATDMAYLADAHLAARPYPPGNPVGKGACVSPGDGSVLDSAAVQLPDLLARLRAEHWKSAGRFPPGPHHPFAPAPPAPGRPPAAALHHAQGAGGRLGSFTAGAANLSRLGSLLMRGGSGSGSGSGGGAQQGPPGERAGAAERERGGGLLRSLSPTSSSSGGGARPPVMRSYSAAPRLSAGFVRPDFGDLAGGGRGSPP